MSARQGVVAVAKGLSGNEKLGACATTYAAQVSCPPDCVFADGGGCYAETGRVGKFVTSPLNAAAKDAASSPLDVAYAEARAIDDLPVVAGRPLRLHTVGDCATDEAARIVSAAAERYMARGGGPVWTYTHAWRSVDRSSWGRVSVLASCETAADVEAARSRGYASSIVLEEFKSDTRFALEAAAVVPCPAQTRHRSCSTCRLCFNDAGLRARRVTIGFELHGIPYAIRQARMALRQPDDPDRRLTAEEQLRRMLERRPSITARTAAVELSMNASYAAQLLAYLRGEADHPSVLRRRRYDRRKAAA